MPKLQLRAAPTFKGTVAIPIHGQAEPEQVEFVFKHASQTALQDYLTSPESKTRSNVQTMLDILEDWPGVDAPFNEANVRTFCDQYAGAPHAVFEAYVNQLAQLRAKN